MGQISFRRRLATRFTHPRLVTDVGTVFVPLHPVDLEGCLDAVDDDELQPDPTLTAYERLVDAECYQLVLSLGWGRLAATLQTLDLGLLRVDDDKVFVVHQLNDDAGTSLILAYLSGDVPARLFRRFLVDYLSSRGAGYQVHLPDQLPQSIWIARPDIVTQAAVATGLLGLVTPGAIAWAYSVGDPDQRPPLTQHLASLMA